MPRTSLTAVLVLLVSGLGCDAGSSDSGASDQPQPAPAHAEPQAAAKAHGASPHAANPHAANPHAANPAMPPHAVAPTLGPPRDVTPSGETREELVEELKLVVPSEWERLPGSSSMRKAEFTLPGPGGDVRLIVYRFPGGAGSADQNIERWKGQVTLAEGEEAATAKLEVGGLKITSVDARGHFAGQAMPGAPPQPPVEDARLLAAAIMGPGDPFYLKLVGPAQTIDVWAEAWTTLLDSLSAGA